MVFDSFDAYYLVYYCPQTDLRAEIHNAEIRAKADEVWEGTPYADDNPFPWLDYAECCKQALKCRMEVAKAKPVKLPGKRINAAGIKARNDIVAVIEQYTTLRKSGHNRFTGRCPLHEDKHPSLTVYADNQSWWCFSCNKGGDVFSFIQAVNACDFRQAATLLGVGDGIK